MVKILVVALGLMLSCSSVQSKTLPVFDTQIQLVQDSGQYPIAPSEAANLAKDANPGSKVLNVKLLPSGVYAVTLKNGGSVSRVMVDATSGSLS